jgi:hypothetical protein
VTNSVHSSRVSPSLCLLLRAKFFLLTLYRHQSRFYRDPGQDTVASGPAYMIISLVRSLGLSSCGIPSKWSSGASCWGKEAKLDQMMRTESPGVCSCGNDQPERFWSSKLADEARTDKTLSPRGTPMWYCCTSTVLGALCVFKYLPTSFGKQTTLRLSETQVHVPFVST